jgi:hypothetical protein
MLCIPDWFSPQIRGNTLTPWDPLRKAVALGIAGVPSQNHVRWALCHHGMARHQIVDGGNGLQIWRVAANIMTKQSPTADKGGPLASG